LQGKIQALKAMTRRASVVGAWQNSRARLGEGQAQKQSAARYEWDKEMILKRLAQGTRGEKRYGFGGAGNAGAAGCKGKSRR